MYTLIADRNMHLMITDVFGITPREYILINISGKIKRMETANNSRVTVHEYPKKVLSFIW